MMKNPAEISFLEHKLDEDIRPMRSSLFCAGMRMKILGSFLFLGG
jgi:hypothetical protein